MAKAKKAAPAKKVAPKRQTTKPNENSAQSKTDPNVKSHVVTMEDFINSLMTARSTESRALDLFNCKITLKRSEKSEVLELLHDVLRSKLSFKDQMRFLDDLRLSLKRAAEDAELAAERNLQDLREYRCY